MHLHQMTLASVLVESARESLQTERILPNAAVMCDASRAHLRQFVVSSNVFLMAPNTT